MTQQEFVIAESEKYVDNSKPVERDECSWQVVYESFSDGLTKGLEIAAEFSEWVIDELIKKKMGKDSFLPMQNDRSTAKDALAIFLTEKYGNNG